MNQSCLELGPATAHLPPEGDQRVGFQLGWDHARHGLTPPAELLLEGTPVGQGWRAGKAVFGSRTLATHRATRLWLALRLQAWREGIAFETQEVTPHYLAQIHAERCPILRIRLGGAADSPESARVERLNPQAAYAAGNLTVMSHRAAQAREGIDVLRALRRSNDAPHSPAADSRAPLDRLAWLRLAVLRSYATPLPFHDAARLPMALLPPRCVRLLNAPQGLQALLTLQFSAPGWAARTRAIAELLPEHSVRHDFNLFVGALAPRVLEAEPTPRGLNLALEDAWTHERVQRRWQHFVLSLGEVATAALLQRCAERGLVAVPAMHPRADPATSGWPLARTGPADRAERLAGTATTGACSQPSPARRPAPVAQAGC